MRQITGFLWPVFSRISTEPYGRIIDSVLIRKNTGQRKPLFWHILRCVYNNIFSGLMEKSNDLFKTSNGTDRYHKMKTKTARDVLLVKFDNGLYQKHYKFCVWSAKFLLASTLYQQNRKEFA